MTIKKAIELAEKGGFKTDEYCSYDPKYPCI